MSKDKRLRNQKVPAHKILQVTVFILNHGRTRVFSRTSNNQLSHLSEIMLRYWLRKCKLSSEHGRNPDLVRFDIHVRGYYGSRSKIDPFSL